MLWIGLAGAGADDPLAPVMQESLESGLRDGVSYYGGIAESAVELLLDAEGEPQYVDGDGNFTKGEALTGAARDEHYAALERQAVGRVEQFLALG